MRCCCRSYLWSYIFSCFFSLCCVLAIWLTNKMADRSSGMHVCPVERTAYGMKWIMMSMTTYFFIFVFGSLSLIPSLICFRFFSYFFFNRPQSSFSPHQYFALSVHACVNGFRHLHALCIRVNFIWKMMEKCLNHILNRILSHIYYGKEKNRSAEWKVYQLWHQIHLRWVRLLATMHRATFYFNWTIG